MISTGGWLNASRLFLLQVSPSLTRRRRAIRAKR
jgi:hypothetical protein